MKKGCWRNAFLNPVEADISQWVTDWQGTSNGTLQHGLMNSPFSKRLPCSKFLPPVHLQTWERGPKAVQNPVLLHSVLIEYLRNRHSSPCPACYEGNEVDGVFPLILFSPELGWYFSSLGPGPVAALPYLLGVLPDTSYFAMFSYM